MRPKEAGAYIGVSDSKLRDLPIPRKRQGRIVVYDRRDLEAYAETLPYEGQEEAFCDEMNKADEEFGCNE
jgi:cephalosporin hydroxylase